MRELSSEIQNFPMQGGSPAPWNPIIGQQFGPPFPAAGSAPD